MKMEILEESPVFNDQTAVKWKRTKRPRSSSASSSAVAGESHRSSFYSSPAASSEISTRTEEDEDMANCLILLARGYSTPPAAAENKFSNRKFTEMATTTAGKVGIYVYECKTCRRTFQSFQALGGHRASHRKPKPTIESDQKRSPPPPPAPANDQEENQFGKVNTDSSLLSNKNYITNDQVQVKPKIHECSICGAEFGSGQALGGHMRRHRAAPPIATARNETSIHKDTPSHDVNEKPRNMLAMDFDLNLPAAPEDVKFDQFSPKQQPRIVFSAAALVDCHY
ncbi:hypothetical protein OROHE_000782 [Orobanche hederae]